MEMNLEQQKKFIDFLDEKWPQPRKCTICGKDKWRIPAIILEIPSFVEDRFSAGESSVPVVTVGCENCGNTYLFNALKIGIVKKDKKKGEKNGK